MDAAVLDQVIDISRAALLMTLKLSLPLLAVGLVIGLMVSLFQALTQIQEQTLAFIPKILAVVATLIFLMPTLLLMAVEYTGETLGMLNVLWRGQ